MTNLQKLHILFVIACGRETWGNSLSFLEDYAQISYTIDKENCIIILSNGDIIDITPIINNEFFKAISVEIWHNFNGYLHKCWYKSVIGDRATNSSSFLVDKWLSLPTNKRISWLVDTYDMLYYSEGIKLYTLCMDLDWFIIDEEEEEQKYQWSKLYATEDTYQFWEELAQYFINIQNKYK